MEESKSKVRKTMLQSARQVKIRTKGVGYSKGLQQLGH